MPFDAEKFRAWEPSNEDKERAQREWALILLGMESVRAMDRLDLLATQRRRRAPRPGSKAWHFLQILLANPDLPAARINALMPEPFEDEADARRLAREWRGVV